MDSAISLADIDTRLWEFPQVPREVLEYAVAEYHLQKFDFKVSTWRAAKGKWYGITVKESCPSSGDIYLQILVWVLEGEDYKTQVNFKCEKNRVNIQAYSTGALIVLPEIWKSMEHLPGQDWNS